MATIGSTKKRTRAKKPSKAEQSILAQFLAELGKEIEAKEGNVSRRMTKGQALVKSMVNEALKGDQRMLGNVLKLIDRLETLKEDTPTEEEARPSKADWELLFAFYGKYAALIHQEIERLKQANPGYWSFDWFQPALDEAPWHEDVHGKHAP